MATMADLVFDVGTWLTTVQSFSNKAAYPAGKGLTRAPVQRDLACTACCESAVDSPTTISPVIFSVSLASENDKGSW